MPLLFPPAAAAGTGEDVGVVEIDVSCLCVSVPFVALRTLYGDKPKKKSPQRALAMQLAIYMLIRLEGKLSRKLRRWAI